MATREALLKAAIKDYKDLNNQVLAIPYKKYIDKQGYSFIIKQAKKSFNLNCAIHIDVEWSQNDFLGNVRNVGVELITRERLTTDVLIEYEDLVIFVKTYDSYNETMGQYNYKGTAIKAVDMVLLKMPTEVYGNSVFDKLVDYDKYKIIPKYLSKSDWSDDIILAEVESLETYNIPNNRENYNILTQMKSDKVIFYLVNFSREKIIQFQNDLAEYSMNFNTFGFLSNFKVTDEKLLDTNAVLKSIITSLEVDLCYNLEVEKKDSETDKFIRNICYKITSENLENDFRYSLESNRLISQKDLSFSLD